MTTRQDEYDRWLRDQVQCAATRGAKSLLEVVQHCRGADPIAVRNAVEACGLTGRLAGEASATVPVGRDAPVHPGIAPPHPLDYEWRFSLGGAETFLRHAGEGHAADLLLLGCATVGILAGDGRWAGTVHSVDRSSLTTDLIESLDLPVRVTRLDLTASSTPPESADIVLMDPPWYLPQAAAFVRAAAASCRVGGRVLGVFPGNGTRPSARTDCEHLTRLSEAQGLRLSRIYEDEIVYETPYFEHNAIRAAGISDDLRGWRRGDLYEFKRVEAHALATGGCPSGCQPWNELRVGPIRVRFRPDCPMSGNIALHRIHPGDILPSVSRRDTRRDSARVWTSGNRVFGCEDPGTLLAAMRAIVEDRDPEAAAILTVGHRLSQEQRIDLRRSCSELSGIIEQEHHEWSEIGARSGSDVVGRA